MKKFLLSIIFICSSLLSYSQTKKLDSLLNTLKIDKEDTIKVTHLNDISSQYIDIGSYDSALVYSGKALVLSNAISNSTGCQSGISTAYNNIGVASTRQGNYPRAVEFFFKALKINETLNDRKRIAKCLTNIGVVYLEQKNYPKAFDYLTKALKINEQLGDKKRTANCFGNIGIIYDKQKNYPKALEYHFKGLKIDEELGNKYGIATRVGNIGIIYDKQKEYSKALEYYFRALKKFEELGAKRDIAINLDNIGSLYVTLKKYPEAEKNLKQALAISTEIGYLSAVKECNENLSVLYIQTGKYKEALAYYKEATIVKDSLFNEERTKEITRYEMNFEFEKKEMTVKAEQEKKNLQVQANTRKKKIITNSIIIILAMFIVAAILLWRQQRIKNKKDKIIFENKQLYSEKEKELLRLEKQRIEEDLLHSKKSLDNYTESLIQKNEILEQFKIEIEKLKDLKSKELYEEKIEHLDYLNKATILTEDDWEKFKELFEQVYKGFFVRLKEKFPDLTPAETRLVCLTKLKLDTKQMAGVLGVSADTIKKTRQRLRKKINISEEESIDDILSFI